MNEKLEKKMDEYFNHFGDSYPMFQVENLSVSEHINHIDNCIKSNKDVYEMGYVNEIDGDY